MHITLITPATKQSRDGNRISALRWASIFRAQNFRVNIETSYNGKQTDLMVALHAWRSAAAIKTYRKLFPEGPLIVVLGGTDVNTFLKSDPETTLASLTMADAIVCLHDLIECLIPDELRSKLYVIRQSAKSLIGPRKPSRKNFDICVIAHLRDEKDPLRAAAATKLLPSDSKIRIIHLGKAYSTKWANIAARENEENSRYNWLGEVPRWKVRRVFNTTNLMVISSSQEGGANVISEAIVAKVPIIASDIPGNIGLLGKNHPGYFPLGDEKTLAEKLYLAETNPKFLNRLSASSHNLENLFSRKKETDKWLQLVTQVME